MADKPLSDAIEHVIVLMLENRSFDNVFGRLYPERIKTHEFDGLTLQEWNAVDPGDPNSLREYVWSNSSTTEPAAWEIPYPDPGELFDDMNEQILGPPGGGAMSGFVANYIKQNPGKPDGTKPAARNIMHYFESGSLPISSTYAKNWAVSDRWFASGPTQTLPNRAFVACATPGYYKHDVFWNKARVNDNDFGWTGLDPNGTVTHKSVYQLLDEAHPFERSERNWKVYYHESALATIVKYAYDRGINGPNITNFDTSDWGGKTVHPTFAEDVAADTLPKYAFIEPRYISNYPDVTHSLPPNSNHPGGSRLDFEDPFSNAYAPPISMRNGEALLLFIVLALARSPKVFNKTLLIVTYDEHGGVYDHHPPPPAVSPYTDVKIDGFDYNRFGVRVPTFFISPRISGRRVFRPQLLGNKYPFDHTTIISTLRGQFGLGGPLTPRDAVAPTLTGLIDLPRASNSIDPEEVEALAEKCGLA